MTSLISDTARPSGSLRRRIRNGSRSLACRIKRRSLVEGRLQDAGRVVRAGKIGAERA